MSASSILVVGIGGVLVLPVVSRVATRRFDPFEPVVLFALAWAVMFVARPTAMLVRGDLSYYGTNVAPGLPRALLLALVGAVAFIVAYEASLGRKLARRLPEARPVETRLGVAAVVLLVVLAVAALLALFEGVSNLHLLLTGRSARLGTVLEGSSSYFWYGCTLSVPAALLSLALVLRDRRPLVLAVAVGAFALAFLRTGPVGGRVFLLPLLGGAFVYLYVRRDRRPGVWTLAAIAAIAVVASYGLELYRQPSTRSTAVSTLLAHPGRAFQPILSGSDAEMAPVLAGALTVVPQRLHYRYGGAVLGDLVTRPIPRQLWSDKPRPPGREVVASVWPAWARSFDPAFTPVLFLFWDFWIVGVVVGMGLFGLGARALYEWFRRCRHELLAQVVFALGVWFVVIGARNDPTSTVVLATFVVAPLFVVNWAAGLHRWAAPTLVARPANIPDR